jgi:ParB-like chromosome segregation protein Spo0J
MVRALSQRGGHLSTVIGRGDNRGRFKREKMSEATHRKTDTDSQLQSIPISDLVPNKYNPNRMSEEEFAEYVAEVEHLGHLSKPIFVRRLKDGKLEIIDGEHGWRAAKKLGFEELLCEVLEDADDFEAMRQTFKRNRGGRDNPVLLGRMFQEMLKR